MIEQLLQNLTDALNRNTAALTGEPVVPGANAAPAPAAKPRGRPPKNVDGSAAEAATAHAAPAATPAPAAAPAAPVTAAAAAATAVAGPSFKEAADALIDLANIKGRDAAVALLAAFGATKAPELKPADYAAFIERAKYSVAPQAAAPASPGAGLI